MFIAKNLVVSCDPLQDIVLLWTFNTFIVLQQSWISSDVGGSIDPMTCIALVQCERIIVMLDTGQALVSVWEKWLLCVTLKMWTEGLKGRFWTKD